MSEKNTISTNDIKSKTIFHNPVLCCQFLRNYVAHPLLKNVQPEDIEDCTERYTPYFGVEFEADTVKRIHLRDMVEGNSELYLISLIEHKSKVDYNVVVQLLKYMVCIWAEYEKQFGTEYKDKVKTKEFRYPPILPVVYHEGRGRWTAPMHIKERIFMQDIFAEYIPDFTYCLINNQDYSNEELLQHNDEMSLIMLLNKIQSSEDLSRFLKIPPEEINRIVHESPQAVIDIIVMVMQTLCAKLNVSGEDTEECVRKVRTRDMGYLWENMDKIDVQGTYELYRKTKAELNTAIAQAQEELIAVKAQAQEELVAVKAQAQEELVAVKEQAQEELVAVKAQAQEELVAVKAQAQEKLVEAKVQVQEALAEAAAVKAQAKEEIARLKALLRANNIQPEEEGKR